MGGEEYMCVLYRDYLDYLTKTRKGVLLRSFMKFPFFLVFTVVLKLILIKIKYCRPIFVSRKRKIFKLEIKFVF